MPKIPPKPIVSIEEPSKVSDGKLGVIDFGRQLVETGDLDPIYTMLWKARLSPEPLRKWLLAYWMFYHAGTSSWICEEPNDSGFWDRVAYADVNRYPRGTERRHFRGELSRKSIGWMSEVGTEKLFSKFYFWGCFPTPVPIAEVMAYVQTWVGFGPWIAFKAADMLERLDICKVSFTEADTFLFDSPKKGAQEVVARYAKGAQVPAGGEPAWAFDYLKRGLGRMLAPPRYERPLNGQEYETILCKWHSHLGGHYDVGKDITEIRHGLLRFPKCKLAQRLRQCI